MGITSEHEYVKHKLPFVKTQYGVYDNTVGRIVICNGRETAHAAADRYPERYTPMKRSISEWLEDR
jgi:hypothetical protein